MDEVEEEQEDEGQATSGCWGGEVTMGGARGQKGDEGLPVLACAPGS